MKKFWKTKAPNFNSIVELFKNNGRVFIGYYHGINKKNNTIYLALTKTPFDEYKKLVIQVLKDDLISGAVLKW